MTPSLDPASLNPALAQPSVYLLGGAADWVNSLIEPLGSLGYRVEAPPQAAEPAHMRNVALVVWSATDPEGGLQPWLERVSQMPNYQEATLFDFRQSDPAIAALWGSLDDGVMGGVSTSQVQWQNGLRFVGQVSTANSGGFASVRTRNLEPPLNLGQWQGTVLYAQGDGQRYKWILRDNPGWDSLAYCRSFDTQTDRLSEVRVPFLEMVATRRARTVPEATSLNPAQLYSMQLMLSKFEYDGGLNPAFQAGSFGLTVQRLGVYRQGPKPLIVLPRQSAEVAPQLTAAELTGVIPQGSGFAVVGASRNLPLGIEPAVVEAILQAVH
ncbi:CIA30 family protein [Nodosilinea sp. LEGE 06152]|uniref:CIA30 family protein n=1 Tax=Nodosilinea sp. LEGE 06152 TaxID=2777966 RepID=UPI001881B3D2|nr:CIA30 family protein [Nodosilinea sp. LEGE 06152]MBE9158395.1 CIA30 family protein [Nodosilinea sp. LEGE 06152]